MDLERWIQRIRSPDPATFEDAYWGDRPEGPDVVPRLLAEMQAAPDVYTRGKFAELLGEMGNASVLPHLLAELSQPDAEMRRWAALALEQLDLPEATEAAAAYREAHPEQFPSVP